MNNRKAPLKGGSHPESLFGSQDRDMVDLRYLMRTIWRRRNVIVLTTLAFSLLAYLFVLQITPTYTSLSKVMLDPQRSQVTGDTKVVSDLEISDSVVNSEVAVLRSNILIEEVIREIGFARLDGIDPANQAPSLKSQLKSSIKEVLRGTGLVQKPVDRSLEQAEIDRMERLVFAVRQRLSVHREGKSLVIGIWLTTEEAELSMLLAKTIADKYIDAQLNSRQIVARQATVWIEDRLKVLQAELDAAEAAGVEYRLKSLTLDGSSLETVSQQLSEMSLRAADAQVERTIAEANLEQLETVVATQGILEAGKQLTSPILETLGAERVKLILEDGVWARDYDENHSARKRLLAEISVIDVEYKREIEKIVSQQRNEVLRTQAREASIRKSLEKMEERLVSISTNAIGLEELQRSIDVSQNAYEELLNRLTETRSQELLQKADARVIENATIPGAPSAPRPKLIVFMGSMVGIAAGFGLVFFLEMSNLTFRTERDVEIETNLPVIASLPRGTWSKPIQSYIEALNEPNGAFSERIRQLRTSLLMLDTQSDGQIILVTSTAPGEGKTTTTLNLAAMAAKAGKSVVVLDCDLRRSNLAKEFGWEPKYGLAHYLNNQCKLQEAIYADPKLPYDVLTSTGSHARFVDVLTKDKLNKTLRLLEEDYDLILIDSPPVLAVSDSLLLAQSVDNIVFVVRWNDTPKAAVSKALTQLRHANNIPTGIVMNMIDPKEYQAEFVGAYSYDA